MYCSYLVILLQNLVKLILMIAAVFILDLLGGEIPP